VIQKYVIIAVVQSDNNLPIFSFPWFLTLALNQGLTLTTCALCSSQYSNVAPLENLHTVIVNLGKIEEVGALELLTSPDATVDRYAIQRMVRLHNKLGLTE